jgi:GABA(A) receptor-associated protein
MNNDYEKFEFKTKFTFAKRKAESASICIKYPERCPIVCEIAKHNQKTISLDRHKYLVPFDLTIGQFMHIIRKRISLSPDQSIFIFTTDNKLPPASNLISTIYNNHMDDDGFLYFSIAMESTFG